MSYVEIDDMIKDCLQGGSYPKKFLYKGYPIKIVSPGLVWLKQVNDIWVDKHPILDEMRELLTAHGFSEAAQPPPS